MTIDVVPSVPTGQMEGMEILFTLRGSKGGMNREGHGGSASIRVPAVRWTFINLSIACLTDLKMA